MLKVAGLLEPHRRGLQRSRRRTLLGVATFVAALMALGSASVEAATINCVTTENDGGCGGQVGSYVGDEGEQSNIWKFFTDGTFTELIYTLEISGSPVTTFDLQVLDRVVTQEELTTVIEGDPPLVNFPNTVCLTTFDEDECGLFDVFFSGGETPEWDDPGYLLQITWFENSNPLSSPPEDGNNTILKAEDFFEFTEELRDILYLQEPVPDDGTISGRGDGFSRFGAFRFTEPVPEPASLILVGTGLVGLLYRSRRKGRTN
jgi:hypothetical protein